MIGEKDQLLDFYLFIIKVIKLVEFSDKYSTINSIGSSVINYDYWTPIRNPTRTEWEDDTA